MLLSLTWIFQKSLEIFSYFRRKTGWNNKTTNDSLSKLPQLIELAEENAVSPIGPQVRDVECVTPSSAEVPMLTHELKEITKHIKLLQQYIDPIPPLEFENAKSFVICYLTLPHIQKLSNFHQKRFLDSIGMLRRDPALSSYAYEKLTILENRFPQLVAEYYLALHKQADAEDFLLRCTPVLVNLKIFYDQVMSSAESQPAEVAEFMCRENRVLDVYNQLEVASINVLSAKRDIFRVLNELEELCSDIDL